MAGDRAILKFPADLGITGGAFHDNKVVVKRGEKLEAKFSDVDNVGAYASIHNFVFAPLYGAEDRPVGMLQLYNKKEGIINRAELRFVGRVQRIMGRLLQNTVELNSAVDMMLSAKSTVERMAKQTQGAIDSEADVRSRMQRMSRTGSMRRG